MKRTTAIAFIAIFLTAGPAAAQNDAVSAIQKLYARTQDGIGQALKAEKEGVGAGLYATDIVMNSHNASWRAVGNYSKKITFWFTDQPEFAVHEDLPPEGVLAKIDVKVAAAVRRENEEYLFDRGRLVFFFGRLQYGSEPAAETRLYFQDGRLIKALSGTTVLADHPEASAVRKRAEAYVKIFLATF
jgi:hypothetical protein